jgi:hypothetical protein
LRCCVPMRDRNLKLADTARAVIEGELRITLPD